MIGVDNSEDMLQIAMDKRAASGHDILYLLQDMRDFELYGTVATVVSICDCMNYILEYDDLVEVFSLVNNYLDPEGIFIFDLNTIYKYKTLLGESTIAEDREESSFIWENYYDRDTMINEYDLALFIRTEEDLYRKYVETHYQKAYSLDTVKRRLKKQEWSLWRHMMHLLKSPSRRTVSVSTSLPGNAERKRNDDDRLYCKSHSRRPSDPGICGDNTRTGGTCQKRA